MHDPGTDLFFALLRHLRFDLVSSTHGGMINRWPHQKTSTLDDVIARNSTQEIKVN